MMLRRIDLAPRRPGDQAVGVFKLGARDVVTSLQQVAKAGHEVGLSRWTALPFCERSGWHNV
jgi:hypothetical protein